MMKKKLTIICGTRPQLIKLQPLLLTLAPHFDVSIINTSQHYSNNLSNHFDLNKDPSLNYISCPSPIGNQNAQIANMILAINKQLSDKKFPDAIIVIGDTNSTLAAAISAAKLSIPLIHLEAGTRSFTPCMPEEQNRIITDSLSDLLLCPTETCLNNLLSTYTPGRIVYTGDILLDLFIKETKDLPSIDTILARLKINPGPYGLLSVHRNENTKDEIILKNIMCALGTSGMNYIFPVHPRTKLLLERISLPNNVFCVDPIGYHEALTLQKYSKVVLTDSGGLMRESYFFGAKLGILREVTEWPEVLTPESNRLLGTDPDSITLFLNSNSRSYVPDLSLFGSGNAGSIIVDTIKDFLT
jgi:UDP-GlcNAc3NAcA epimerase